MNFLMLTLHPHSANDSGVQDDMKKVDSLNLINYSLITSPVSGHCVLKSMERAEEACWTYPILVRGPQVHPPC